MLAIVIIALPISGLLFPKNHTWKLSNFLKFLLILLFSKGRKVKISQLFMNQSSFWWASLINDYYDFCLQPPGDPRAQHPADARQRKSLSKLFFLCKSI